NRAEFVDRRDVRRADCPSQKARRRDNPWPPTLGTTRGDAEGGRSSSDGPEGDRAVSRRICTSILWVTGLSLTCAHAWGQVRERDVTVTGPGGRTLERSVVTERKPGGIVDRQV